MRIFMSSIYYPDALTCGICRHTSNLYHAFKKAYGDVNIMYPYPNKRVQYGIRYSHIHNRLMMPELAKVFSAGIALNQKADVYYADYPTSALPLLLAARRPLVVTFHDINPLIHPEWQHPIYNWWHRLCYKIAERAERIVFVSESARNDALEHTKIKEEKTVVIYNGVDEKYKPQPSKKKNENEFVIGYIGGYSKSKNVRALLRIAEELPDLKFKLCGNFGLHHDLELEAWLPPNVEVGGYIPETEMVDCYNSFDAFVFPSLYEGFGLPPLEAMKCGIPTIVMNATGVSEVVGGGAMIANNVKEMKDCVASLHDSQSLQREYGRRGVERAKQFTWGKTIEEYKKLFEEVRR